jgi:prophage regulatory protein
MKNRNVDAADLKFIRLGEVLSRIPLSRSAIYSKISAGEFPKPVSLSSQSVGWIESEVQAWMEKRVAASRSRGHSIC